MNRELNLARKRRPRRFSEMIGQDLSVRMLQNSLYLKKLFPLYIFAGQRGCGKTTLARIFAGALNCEQLPLFQADPKKIILPCTVCFSCEAFKNSQHPDFIEMDAASHTGVDNARQILDSATYVPVIGSTKIYLIDEAHMLSKAAFNAFLKMLEEPPPSALFILATTELYKIPETVRSRAFHVFFNAIPRALLVDHLLLLCEQENISAERAACEVIAREAEGSVRDAVNLLDQARLAATTVTYDGVLALLGKLREEVFLELFSYVAQRKGDQVLRFLKSLSFERLMPKMVWDMIIQLLRALLWQHYGVEDDGPFGVFAPECALLAQACPKPWVVGALNLFWEHEDLFLKTTQKHILLEMLLVRLAQSDAPLSHVAPAPFFEKPFLSHHVPSPVIAAVAPGVSPLIQEAAHTAIPPEQSAWEHFVQEIEKTQDHLLASIFKQASLRGMNEPKKSVIVTLKSVNTFILGKLESSAPVIKAALATTFIGYERIIVEVTSTSPSSAPLIPEEKIPQAASSIAPMGGGVQSKASGPSRPFVSPKKNVRRFDIPDAAAWPKATLIARHFSGTLEKVEE